MPITQHNLLNLIYLCVCVCLQQNKIKIGECILYLVYYCKFFDGFNAFSIIQILHSMVIIITVIQVFALSNI